MNPKLLALLLAFGSAAIAADQPVVTVQPAKDRKPAPQFALKDASGKTVKLRNYHGKVVLLDFWATWCTGCKQEMPWFVEFQKKYGPKGLAVVGVSMDEDGWVALKPFLAKHREFSYTMLLGNPALAQHYDSVAALPDTFLIDKKGDLAAAYKGVVDRDAVEANIQELLSRK